MPFTFIIQPDQSIEVHRDPEGHYHHLSVLVGTLTAGSVSIGDTMLFPSSLGTPLVGRVVGFDALSHTFGQTVAASEAPSLFGISIRSPAPPTSILLAGPAQACIQAEYEEALLVLLRRDPTLFFHYRKRDPVYRQVCQDCLVPLKRLPAAVPVLHELCSHPEEIITRVAIGLLHVLQSDA